MDNATVILAFHLAQILWDIGDFFGGLSEPWLCTPSVLILPFQSGGSLEVPIRVTLKDGLLQNLAREAGLVWTLLP